MSGGDDVETGVDGDDVRVWCFGDFIQEVIQDVRAQGHGDDSQEIIRDVVDTSEEGDCQDRFAVFGARIRNNRKRDDGIGVAETEGSHRVVS